jgi:hypothetical protein
MLVGAFIALTAGFVALASAPDRQVEELAARWAPPPSEFVTVAALQSVLALP